MTSAVSKSGTLSVGRLYCDMVFTDVPRLPSMGTEVYAGGFGIHAGGGAAITAAYLVQLGGTALLAAYLPRGPLGLELRGQLETVGVDLSLCGDAAAGLGLQTTVALVGAEDRAFVTHRAGPAAPKLSPDILQAHGVGHIHVGELATLVEMPELIDLKRRAGCTMSLDCAWDEALTLPDVAPLIAAVDVFLPNETEIDWLRTLGMDFSQLPLTVIKKGADGAALLYADGREQLVPTTPHVPLDTTGAGDAFNAGFLTAWRAGDALEACLAEGNRAGNAAIRVRGGFEVKHQRVFATEPAS